MRATSFTRPTGRQTEPASLGADCRDERTDQGVGPHARCHGVDNTLRRFVEARRCDSSQVRSEKLRRQCDRESGRDEAAARERVCGRAGTSASKTTISTLSHKSFPICSRRSPRSHSSWIASGPTAVGCSSFPNP
jgi:hypothetical protein